MLAGLLGLSIASYLLLSANVDLWQWWVERQNGSDELRVVKDRSIDSPGLVSAVQPEPVGTDSSVAAEPVRLVLKRTRLGRNTNEGYAELGVNAASPQTYRAGAILANGTRIEEIHSDHVVLTRNGHSVRLYIDGRAPAGLQSFDNSLALVGGSEAVAPAVADSADELTNHIRVAPVYEGEVIRALEVYSTQHSNAFTALGLEPGDRITAINGHAITSFAEAIGSLRQLADGAALLVTVERDGRLQALALDGLILTTARTAVVK